MFESFKSGGLKIFSCELKKPDLIRRNSNPAPFNAYRSHLEQNPTPIYDPRFRPCLSE